MKVVSIGGIANDDTNYHMWLEAPFSQPSLKLERTQREGGDPLVTRARREGKMMNLGILVYGDDEAETKTLREALLAALDTDDAAISLIVSDDDEGDERYRYVIVSAVDEQRNEEGPGQLLVATLVTHGETRWRSTSAVSETWNVTASGDTQAIANDGSLPARPVYTIKPTDSKSGSSNAFAYRVFCAVKWEGRTATHYPVNITDAAWDTEALIDAFTLYIGSGSYQDNVAVSVDGAMRKRWFGSFDTASTSVWVNLDWIYCPSVDLGTGFSSGDSVTELVADSDIVNFPFSGILQIGDEIFTYTEKDNATRTFGGVTRATKGSDAEVHTAGDAIHLIQHDIWLLYGGTGYWNNSYDRSGPDQYGYLADSYKPMIDLDDSSNVTWQFKYFGQSTTGYGNRAMTWRRGGAPNSTGTEGNPYDEITVTNNYSTTIQEGESYWWIPTAFNLAFARVIGRAGSYESGVPWQVGLYSGGGVYVNIPEMESFGSPLVDFDLTATETRYGEDVRFYQRCGGAMECRLDEVWLQWDEYPVATMCDEIAMYDLSLTLENLTTGQSITLTLPMALDEQLEVDTENHTVTLLDDGSSQYQALERSTRRREILPLLPGNNTLKVTESGLQGVTVYIEFEERSYS